MKLSSSIVLLLTLKFPVNASNYDGMSLPTNDDSVRKLSEKKKSRPIIHDDSRKSENKLTKTGTTTNPVFSPIPLASVSDHDPLSSDEKIITIYGLDRSIPLTKDETEFLEEIIQDAYNKIHEGRVEEEEELDEKIITIYGLDRSIPLTKDETEFLEETIQDAYNKIHEGQVEEEGMYSIVDVNKITMDNNNNKEAENMSVPTTDDVPTVENLRATRNPVVTKVEEKEHVSSAIPRNLTFDSLTVFFFIVGSLYIVLD
jgi:hypothetical protein